MGLVCHDRQVIYSGEEQMGEKNTDFFAANDAKGAKKDKIY